MPSIKQKIITIDAQAVFKFYAKKLDEKDKLFTLDLGNYFLRKYVVKQEAEREDCALFHQFCKEIEAVWQNKGKTPFEITNKTLYDKLVIVDFGDIFLPPDEETASVWQIEHKKDLLSDAKDLVESGFNIYFEGCAEPVHMVAFDKSGSMSRNSRLSFIDEAFYDGLNMRLNLGMDFSKIQVIESKYYAYRGLYLSSSKRVNHPEVVLNPETIVVLKDVRTKKNNPEKPVAGPDYDKEIPLATTEIKVVKNADSREVLQCRFLEAKIKDYVYVNVPFDGSGLITPEYASYINEALGISGAASFQVRLPFIKGMLHEVDVHDFLDTYNGGAKEHWYEDAFGIKRDLSKAHIFITASMFKGMKWIVQYLDSLSDAAVDRDPMAFYCDVMKKYDHALYISGTDLPYKYAQYTHLSYQMINTLNFTKEQFESIVNKHCFWIENPVEYLKKCEGMTGIDDDGNTLEKDKTTSLSGIIPNWKQALFKNAALENDRYIRSQLRNIQKGLLTKLVTGKLLVEGHTRYLCRDLLPLLASLLEKERYISGFWKRYLWRRFYLPVNAQHDLEKELGLGFDSYYAFFRSPHLSRNEQVIMKRYKMTTEELYTGEVEYTKFKRYVEKFYDKYLKKLTGVVMVPRGSSAPLCMGGADFDGDLVNIVANQCVVNAVASGAYVARKYQDNRTHKTVPFFERKLPIIEIPASQGKLVTIKKHVPFSHIQNTFSNRIGQISDAAIAIGQTEYDRNAKQSGDENTKFEFASNAPSCAKCTILTGLEIDAAKSGLHPDLNIVLKNGDNKSAYVSFLRSLEKLRGEEGYTFENLSTKRKNDNGKTNLCVSAKSCKTEAKFELQNGGTYINELPLYFEKALKEYQRKKNKKEKGDFFACPQEVLPHDQKNMEKFAWQCQMVLNSYSFYTNKFLPVLTKEKKDTFYAPENLQMILFQIYDEEQVVKIQRTVIPGIQEKIEACINQKNTVEDMKKRMNQMQWLLQPEENRGNALERIIGNGFEVRSLSKEEQEVLFHFEQHGYKILWNLLSLIEGPQVTAFAVLKERVVNKAKTLSDRDKTLEKELESIVQGFYEKNETDPKDKLYTVCLRRLRKIVMESKDLPLKLQLAKLYQKARKSEEYGRFFWEVFKWEEIEPYIEEGNGNVK